MRNEFDTEYIRFMNEFLKAHPEVVEDQKVGWDIYWNPRRDAEAMEERDEDPPPPWEPPEHTH